MKEQILNNLHAECPWRDTLHWYDTISSTNTTAKEMAAAGAPHGTVLIADSQTGGRGRMGRSFLSPAGTGIYLSVILRPRCKPAQLMHLTCATAVAMCNAVEASTGFRPGIKWTNDLVFGRRKLGGILTELSVDADTGLVRYAVVGVGINCTQTEGDFPPPIRDMACSLAMAVGAPVDRSRIAAAMIEALENMDRMLLKDNEPVMDVYRQDCITLGQDIVILRGEEKTYGKALDVDAQGGLTVALTNGEIKTVTSGEVSVRGMYGYV